MTQLEQLLPERRTLPHNVLTLGAPSGSCPDPAAIEFCARLSQLLLNDARARLYPDLQALGFWLRPAQINMMLRDYLTPQVQTVVVPAGTVLALPPGNVDALFGYIVAMALLCGNTIVARLSSAVSPAQELLVTMLDEALNNPAVRVRVTLLHYGHDDVVTAKLSAHCDLRLVWGGDATVQHVRQIPLAPLAREISFGDRFSAAAIDAAAYLAANGTERTELTQRFYNDVYWYDQMACAAPRLLFWVGDADLCAEAATEFYQRLAATAVQMGYRPDAGASVAKQTMAYLGLHDLQPQDYQTYGTVLSVLTISDFTPMSAFKRVNYGYGILVAIAVPTLAAIAAHAERRDQTLTYWGFTPQTMAGLASQCGGRGFDRIVPVGQALHFDPVWDGCNLFAALTRTVRVI